MKYEVQTYTLVDGWVNCWTTFEGNGEEYPTTFASIEEAQQELDDLREEWPAAMMDEYRIVEVES